MEEETRDGPVMRLESAIACGPTPGASTSAPGPRTAHAAIAGVLYKCELVLVQLYRHGLEDRKLDNGATSRGRWGEKISKIKADEEKQSWGSRLFM